MAYAETDQSTGAGRSLPATFPDRGAYLPFTTPELVHARVRELQTGAGTVVFIPRRVGTRRATAVPLRSLEESFSLSVHDRALYAQIMATRATTPAKINRIGDKLAYDGLAGALEMRRARAARRDHQCARLRLFMFLVGNGVEQICGDDDHTLAVTPGSIASSDGLERARDALSPFAIQHNLSGQELINRLERWARVTACVGSVHGQITGYITATTDAMTSMAQSLDSWLRTEPEESAEMAEWVVKACNSTLDYANMLLERVNQPATDIGGSVIAFDATFRAICADVEKLIWLTDGWASLARRWEAVSGADRFAQRDALEELVRYLPLLPNDLLNAADCTFWSAFQKRQLSWQKSIDRPRQRQTGAQGAARAPKAAPQP